MDTNLDFSLKKALIALLGVAGGILLFFMLHSLAMAPRIVASVFLIVIIFWITEVFPLFVTALLGPFLMALLLGPLAPELGMEAMDYRIFIYPFASPVIVLLFGGFLMARVFSTYHLDTEFSGFFISRLGNNPKFILLGFMALTAFMSMWMSNTATTAIMVTSVLPIVRKLPEGSRFTKALLLGIPFSANIGGIGTPIGTPPNAIAIGMLSDAGRQISFFKWMCAGIPPVIVLLLFTWVLLMFLFPTGQKDLEIRIEEVKRAKRSIRYFIYGTIAVTIILWLTDALHGISSSLIAMIPVIVFMITGLCGKKALREISWEVLFLVGGGISMGVAITKTGLGNIIIDTLNLKEVGLVYAGLIMGGMAALLSTLMSNTASSNLLIPIAISLSSVNPVFMAITTAICASMGMGLPISTPPNAIAYGSEMISVKDMFRTGIIITLLGVLLVVLYEYNLLSFLIKQ